MITEIIDPSCKYPYVALWNHSVERFVSEYKVVDSAPADTVTVRIKTQSFSHYIKNYSNLNIVAISIPKTQHVVVPALWSCETDKTFVAYVVDVYCPKDEIYRVWKATEVESTQQHQKFIKSLSRIKE